MNYNPSSSLFIALETETICEKKCNLQIFAQVHTWERTPEKEVWLVVQTNPGKTLELNAEKLFIKSSNDFQFVLMVLLVFLICFGTLSQTLMP